MTPNEKRHDTPLWQLIDTNWGGFDAELHSPVITADDVLLYVLWCFDGLKDANTDTERLCNNLWSMVHGLVRQAISPNGERLQADEQEKVTNAVCAFVDICWGMLLTLSPAHRKRYMQFLSHTGKHWADILACRQRIKEDENLRTELKKWLIAYMNSEVFYTTANMGDRVQIAHERRIIVQTQTTNIDNSHISNFYENG